MASTKKSDTKQSPRKRGMASGAKLPKAPKIHGDFIERYPALAQAWDLIHDAGACAGPLDAKTQRIVKLAIAIGSKQQGAVHSSVRKALAMGVTVEELEQVVALAAGTLGMPASVAAYGWIQDVADRARKR
jgi:alkylhydroperoxidase/carboxymuconolactone decarboxylase family protein YurZ